MARSVARAELIRPDPCRVSSAVEHREGGGAFSHGSLLGTYILKRTSDQAYSALTESKISISSQFSFSVSAIKFYQNFLRNDLRHRLGPALKWYRPFYHSAEVSWPYQVDITSLLALVKIQLEL